MSGRTLRIDTAAVFQPLLQPARDKAALGGRGSGKSHFFAGLLIEDSLAEPGVSGEGLRSICIREVQKDLAQSSKALIEAKLAQFRIGEADGFKVYRDAIATPGDGVVIFKGMNDYTADSIKSLEGFKRAWWEEAQTATARSIDLLRPTLRATGSQLWWSLNPRRKVDPVDVMLRGPDRLSDAIVVTANWRDNPWFTPELEQERRDCLRMKPDQYDHIWEGEYVKAVEGAYYTRHLKQARDEKRFGVIAADPALPIGAFWDIGTTDACAIWIAQFVGHQIRMLDYYEAVGQPLATHLHWLRTHWPFARCVLPHDGANVNHVTATRFEDHVRQAGFEVMVVKNQGRGAAMQRIEALRRVFPQIWFNEAKTAAGVEALSWYHERRDEPRSVGLGPRHDWSSHAADAAGLMALVREEPAPRRTYDDQHEDDYEHRGRGRSSVTGY